MNNAFPVSSRATRGISSTLLALAITITLLLNGCSTSGTKSPFNDGPPPFDVDVSKIPDAIPQNLPPSKIGNKPCYTVFGKRYRVMSSSKNYRERGVASWYGTKFHARHTSSGERYNMLAMTAAHKTLPLPTFLEVTNLKNGKKIIVKVNDRGPFEANRIIDLSYVAAKKLGMLGRGTTYVELKAIDPIHYAAEHNAKRNYTIHAPVMTAKQSQNKSHIYLQVGTFQSKNNATNLQSRLTTLFHAPVSIAHNKKMYRVQIGPIQDMATVDNISHRLKSLGLHSKILNHSQNQEIP